MDWFHERAIFKTFQELARRLAHGHAGCPSAALWGGSGLHRLLACPCSERVLRGAGVTVQVLANPVSTPVQFECLLADFLDGLCPEPNFFGKCQDLVCWPANETGSNVAYAAHVVLLLMAILGDKRVPLVG